MRPEDIYIGQQLKIRDYDEMVRETGSPYPYSFIKQMDRFCGRIITVQNIRKDGRETRIDFAGDDGFIFLAEVFEPCFVCEDINQEFDLNELFG